MPRETKKRAPRTFTQVTAPPLKHLRGRFWVPVLLKPYSSLLFLCLGGQRKREVFREEFGENPG